MVDFLWGAESAHEDSIGLVVLVSTDPPALLTSGADRCVKAWTLDGRPQGLLLQGLAPHAPNPRWSFRCAGLQSRVRDLSSYPPLPSTPWSGICLANLAQFCTLQVMCVGIQPNAPVHRRDKCPGSPRSYSERST